VLNDSYCPWRFAHDAGHFLDAEPRHDSEQYDLGLLSGEPSGQLGDRGLDHEVIRLLCLWKVRRIVGAGLRSPLDEPPVIDSPSAGDGEEPGAELTFVAFERAQ
jgi:hypothetical protein